MKELSSYVLGSKSKFLDERFVKLLEMSINCHCGARFWPDRRFFAPVPNVQPNWNDLPRKLGLIPGSNAKRGLWSTMTSRHGPTGQGHFDWQGIWGLPIWVERELQGCDD